MPDVRAVPTGSKRSGSSLINEASSDLASVGIHGGCLVSQPFEGLPCPSTRGAFPRELLRPISPTYLLCVVDDRPDAFTELERILQLPEVLGHGSGPR